MSVLSLADAKTILNVTSTTNDTEIQALIDSAEAAIAKKCGPLASTATTATHVYGQTTVLQLPRSPAISLTSVTANDGTTVTLADLSVTSSGTVEFTAGGTFGAAWYTVVYQAGRSSVPTDLLLAVKKLVKHLWADQRGPGGRPGGMQESPVYPGQFGALPPDVEDLLEPHLQAGFA